MPGKLFGYDAFDIEIDLDRSTGTLDEIVEDARNKINVTNPNSRDEALEHLRTIDTILKERGLRVIRKASPMSNEAIRFKRINCYSGSSAYLTIAEAMNLPIVGVHAPGHIYVRWLLEGGDPVEWETTVGKEWSLDMHKRLRNISQESIDRGVFLKDLTREETMAIPYYHRGLVSGLNANLDLALEDIDRALNLNPNLPEAYTVKAVIGLARDNPNNAIENIEKAIYMHPNSGRLYNIRGRAKLAKNSLIEAGADFIRASYHGIKNFFNNLTAEIKYWKELSPESRNEARQGTYTPSPAFAVSDVNLDFPGEKYRDNARESENIASSLNSDPASYFSRSAATLSKYNPLKAGVDAIKGGYQGIKGLFNRIIGKVENKDVLLESKVSSGQTPNYLVQPQIST